MQPHELAKSFPPCTNRGGKPQGVIKDAKMLQRNVPPGEIKNTAIIDYLSFTFKPSHASAWEYQGTEIKRIEGDKQIPKEITDAAWFIAGQLSKLVSYMEIEEKESGIFGYRKSFAIKRGGEQAGIIAWGGNSATIYVSLSGFGCYGVDMAKMYKLISILPAIRITRCDLAHDDFKGERDIRFARRAYLNGGFTNRGRPPAYRYIEGGYLENGRLNPCNGNTFYVGKRENGKQLRVYEKGKQLGEKDSRWVRWELELHNVDRVIPLDILLRPAHYLSGAYPVMQFLDAEQALIPLVKKTLTVSFDHLKKYCAIAYGKLVYAMQQSGWTESEIIRELSVEGIPKRLNGPIGAAPIALCA